MISETGGLFSPSPFQSHSNLEAFSSSSVQFSTEPSLIFSNEIRLSQSRIGKLQEFVALTRQTNSPVLQALGNSIWHAIMPTIQLCREYEEKMLRETPGNGGYLRRIFRLKSQMQLIHDIFNFLESYCLHIEIGKQFDVSQSIHFLNFLFGHLKESALSHGLDDSKSQVFLKIFSDCLAPISGIVDSLLSRTLSCKSNYILASCKECYSLRDLKILEAISSRLDSVLNDYIILRIMSEPQVLEEKGKSLHELFTETISYQASLNSQISFSLRWNEIIALWSKTTLLEFQKKNMHAILQTCNILEVLDSLHRSIFGGSGEKPFDGGSNWKEHLQYLKSGHFLGAYCFETFQKMLQFSRLTKTTAFILGRMPRKLLTRLEMRIAFEMQHFLNILLNCIQEGQLLWFQKTRQKLLSTSNMFQFRSILNEHNTTCASYLFCRQNEKPIYDAISLTLDKITQFVKYCRRLSPEKRVYRDVQMQQLAIVQAYQKSCNMIYTVLSFKRNENDIDPLLQDNIQQLLVKYNYNNFYGRE